jgi:hypothetical protein
MTGRILKRSLLIQSIASEPVQLGISVVVLVYINRRNAAAFDVVYLTRFVRPQHRHGTICGLQ